MIEPDNEAQEKIDAEEEAAGEFVDEKDELRHLRNTRAEDSADEEATEMELLKQLEGLDRQLQAVEADKDATVKVFNKRIKDITKSRNAHLKNIEAWRLGERGLFE